MCPAGHTKQESTMVIDPIAKSARGYTLDNSLPSAEISVQRHERKLTSFHLFTGHSHN